MGWFVACGVFLMICALVIWGGMSPQTAENWLFGVAAALILFGRVDSRDE